MPVILVIRKATPADAEVLMDLYHNHLSRVNLSVPTQSAEKSRLLHEKLARFEADPMYHLLVGEIDGRVVSSVTLVVVENLTRDMHHYAIIENVVTHADFRGKGYAAALMQKATEIAAALGCYKIMLLTGSKKESTLRFYEKCGFNSQEKTGFIRWLKDDWQGY